MEKNGIEIDEIYANAKNDIIAFVKKWAGLKNIQYNVCIDSIDPSDGLITSIEENGVTFFDGYDEYILPFTHLTLDKLYEFAKWLNFNYSKK